MRCVIRVLKLFSCIVILFCGAIVGVHLSHRLVKRRDILAEFDMMLHRTLIQIEYNAGDLYEAFSDNFAGYSFDRNAPFDEQWRDLVKSCSAVLTKEDRFLLTGFSDGFGTADSESQRRHIIMCRQLLREQIDSAKEDIRTKSKMYRIVPLSAGIVISLLLI